MLFKRGLVAGLIGGGVFLVGVELVSAVLIVTGVVPERYPSYRIRNITDHFLEHHRVFGVWHKKNSRYKRDMKSKVVYTSNSFGAADRERTIKNKTGRPRVLVLGDSFVEGRGVSQEKRYTNLLENAMNIAHLNFGSSGYFGTTQYYLVYKHLAKQFDHDLILIGILPDNDFLDNDIEYGKQFHSDNYRPYFVGPYPDYDLIYYDSDFSFDTFQRKQRVKAIFREFTFSYSALKYLVMRSVQNIRFRSEASDVVPTEKLKSQARVYSGYYDFTDSQFALLQYTLEKINEEAMGIPIVVVTYPTIHDLVAFRQLGPPPLVRKLRVLSQELGVQYFDALSYFYHEDEKWGKYYLFGLDGGHWTEYGNQVMADFLKPIVEKQLGLSFSQ